MSVFAQDLLDLIIDICDFETLKECSLAASCLRYRSQRSLFRSLKLRAKKFGLVSSRLADSPHIAEYFTTLTLMTQNSAEIETTLNDILLRLRNIRRLELGGQWIKSRSKDRDPLPAPIHPVIVNFIERQCLEELNLEYNYISPALLSYFLGSISRISTASVTVRDTDDERRPTPTPSQSPVRYLKLQSSFEHLCLWLGRPEITPLLAHLRTLALPLVDQPWTTALLAAAANTLERVDFHCVYGACYFLFRPFSTGIRIAAKGELPRLPLPLPLLPALHSIHFHLLFSSFHHRPIDSETIAALIAPGTMPALKDIVTHLSFVSSRTPEELARIPEHDGTLFSVLEDAVGGSERTLTVGWILRVSRKAESVGQSVAGMIREGMPLARLCGQLDINVVVKPSW
ncbi:hypothetical protein FB45DRAFT_1061063 [Roridomyces roridus]|uniref:Uncharacterized protein n=1 Tax=Roridomyces roridus TaxID=1738132 RepID=A0AAD7BML8_9AGAR|nr:hypothetical protein FB45DRAFT_1061063 [Roridomyces roridus]